MFKRLSLLTVMLSGILLAGCANQPSATTRSASNSTQTQESSSSKKKSAVSKTKPSSSDDDVTSDSKVKNENDTDSGKTSSSTSQGESSQQNTDNNTNTNNSSNTDSTNTNQTDQNQQSQTQQQGTTNLTNSAQAVTYLANQLSSTYDKTTTQYVYNGKTTWNDVEGYQVNVYGKDSDSPVGSYLVPADGKYFQIW